MWEIVTILVTVRYKVTEMWEIVTILFTDRWKVTRDVKNGNNTLYWQMKSNGRCEK